MLELQTSIAGPVLWRRLFQCFLPPANDQIIFLSRLDDKAAEGRGGWGGQRGNQDPTLPTASASRYSILFTEICWGGNSNLILHFSVIVKCTDHNSGRQIRRGEYPCNPEVDTQQRIEMQKAASICAEFYAFATLIHSIISNIAMHWDRGWWWIAPSFNP